MYIKKSTKKISFKFIVSFILSAIWMSTNIAYAEKPVIAWQQGAKLGTIALFYTAETPVKDLPECLATLPKEEISAKRYVKVWYHHVRHIRNEVAELPSSMQDAKLADHVEIWPADCSKGKLSRISQVFNVEQKFFD